MVHENLVIEVKRDFDPNMLTYSSIESGRFGSEVIHDPAWAELAQKALLHAYNFVKPLDKNGVVQALRDITGFKVCMAEFKKAQRVRGTPLWYLGQDAKDIWSAAQWIACLLGTDMELTVRWKVHPRAAYPGESRLVRYENTRYWQ